MQIDYDELVADYQAGLFTKLRGFGPAAAFLETWVPDEDPMRSLLNMVEAAETFGQSEFSVAIGGDTARRIDVAALRAMVGPLGRLSAEPRDDGLVLAVSGIGA